jgi:alpha-beta hydrolase superfamily lysophospholipase
MEAVSFRNARDRRLVGLLHRADPVRIVVMAHGFCNDKSSQGRFDRIAEALHREGLSVLRFDFGGCGESDDETIDPDRKRISVDPACQRRLTLRSAPPRARPSSCRGRDPWLRSARP